MILHRRASARLVIVKSITSFRCFRQRNVVAPKSMSNDSCHHRCVAAFISCCANRVTVKSTRACKYMLGSECGANRACHSWIHIRLISLWKAQTHRRSGLASWTTRLTDQQRVDVKYAVCQRRHDGLQGLRAALEIDNLDFDTGLFVFAQLLRQHGRQIARQVAPPTATVTLDCASARPLESTSAASVAASRWMNVAGMMSSLFCVALSSRPFRRQR